MEDVMNMACSTSEEKRKPEGNRPLEKPRRKCVDNIKMYLGMGWYGLH
jgi:hypothetical protein